MLSALATLWEKRHDVTQAIALERQALFIYKQLNDTSAVMHCEKSLTVYLEK